jgi:hypothetical protein
MFLSMCAPLCAYGGLSHTGDQGNRVLAAELSGLEDIRVDRSEGCRPVSISKCAALLGEHGVAEHTSRGHRRAGSASRCAPQERL